MLQISSEMIAGAIEAAIPQLACRLPKDIYDALKAARAGETGIRGCAVLDDLIENASVACMDGVPICQDTGTVWVCLEVGSDMQVPGDVFSGVDDAVAKAYQAAALRKSVVFDALSDRSNTGTNAPAFKEIRTVAEKGVMRLHIMLKGGGSDNASLITMLVPGVGREGIIECVVARVREKASSACAPLVVGVGIGSTFDKVGALAKHALMRKVGSRASSDAAADLEHELSDRIAESYIGPGGLGGTCGAMSVFVETAPCHIAALPVAINMGCSALRRATLDLACDESILEQLDRQLVSERDFASAFVRGHVDETESLEAKSAAISLTLPRDCEKIANLSAGQRCFISGEIYTLRDAGHVRLLEELERNNGHLPYGLEGQTIFYAGPTPAAAGRPFGAIGPTTAGRMDFAAPRLYDAGILATIGKGTRSETVHDACRRNRTVYFVATGGAAALLAKHIESSEIVAYEDLGTEALRRLIVKDFPVFVGIDSGGVDVYRFE